MVEYCLQAGADPNQRDSYSSNGDCLLHTAVCEQDLALAQILLLYGAEVNALNAQGNSPLHILLEELNLGLIEAPPFAMIETLLKYGAYTDSINHNKETALDLAYACKDPEVLALVLRYANDQGCD